MARILVAEPDPDVLALIERALENWGHEPIRFQPGTQPVGVDVMILEPTIGPRGTELAEALASASPSVPLIIVSIYPPDPSASRTVAHILKPFSLSALQAAVEKAVSRSTSAS